MILNAIEEFALDVQSSFMVGDSWTDIEAGSAAGLKTVFIGNYKCDSCRMLDQKPDFIVKDLFEFSQRFIGKK